MPRADMDFLTALHPVYSAQAARWAEAERRLRGGYAVLDELVPFEHETRTGDRYLGRQKQATYVNFPDIYLQAMIGHLFRAAPEPDKGISFGTLGEVARSPGVTNPSRAEMVWFNADGAGRDGSQWNSFWSRCLRRAAATGHRWIMCESTRRRPESLSDEMRGLRPYLVDYSPLSVTNWEYTEGRLDWAILQLWVRNARVVNGKLEGNDGEPAYLLMVRDGVTALGSRWAGGWWQLDKDGNEVEGRKGKWESTGGEIPFWPLFWERDETPVPAPARSGSPADVPKNEPSLSRSGIMELSQVAVSYMNLSSAADFDAYDAAASLVYALGVDVDAFNVMATKLKEGAKFIPVPANTLQNSTPSIVDSSAGAVASDVFDRLLLRKREEARELAAMQATSTPDSSGRSKEAGFADTKSPRLSLLAQELETAQNTALHFLELRFGTTRAPTGSVRWPKEFDLQPLVADIEHHFTLEELAGVRSPTLDGKLLLQAAQEKGLINEADEDFETVRTEYEEAARTAVETRQRELDLLRGAGGGPAGETGAPGGAPGGEAPEPELEVI